MSSRQQLSPRRGHTAAAIALLIMTLVMVADTAFLIMMLVMIINFLSSIS
jgi:hypothetical protein